MALRVTAFNTKLPEETSQNDDYNTHIKSSSSSLWSQFRRVRPGAALKGLCVCCGMILLLVLLWRVQTINESQLESSLQPLGTGILSQTDAVITPITIQLEQQQHGVINRMKSLKSTVQQSKLLMLQRSAQENELRGLASPVSTLHQSHSQQHHHPSSRKWVDPIHSTPLRVTPFAPVSNFRTTLGRPLKAAILGLEQKWAETSTMAHSSHFTRCNRMMYSERFEYDVYDFTLSPSTNPWLEKFLQEYRLPWLKLPLIREFLRFAIKREHLEYDVVVWVDSDISFDLSASLNEFIISADARDFLTDPAKLFLLWNDHEHALNFGFLMVRTHNIPLVLSIIDKVLEVPNLSPSDTSLQRQSHNVSRELMKQSYPAEAGAFNIAVCMNPKLQKHVMFFTSPFIHGPQGSNFHHVSPNFHEQQWSFFQTEFALQWRARQLLLSHNMNSARWAKKWARKQIEKKTVDDYLAAKLGVAPLHLSCPQIFHSHRCYGNCLSQSCSKCVCGSISYNQTIGEPLIRMLQQYDLPQTLVSHQELACLIEHRSLGNPRAVSEVQVPTTATAGAESSKKAVLLTGLMQLSPADCPSVVSSDEQLCSLEHQMECIRHILLNGQNDLAKAKAAMSSTSPADHTANTARLLYIEATRPWTLPSSCGNGDLLQSKAL